MSTSPSTLQSPVSTMAPEQFRRKTTLIAEVDGRAFGSLPQPDAPDEIARFVIDSRMVTQGDCFIAIGGTRVDGFDFIVDAIKDGASLVITERTPADEMSDVAKRHKATILVVDDVIETLGKLARAYRKTLKALGVGVTGSSGKTTTKELIASVLSQKYVTWSTSGNHNNDIGLPLDLLNCPPQVEMLVFEMGMSGLGEIAYLSSIALIQVAAVTYVGTSHISELGSRDAVARAKSEIITGLEQGLSFGDALIQENFDRFGGLDLPAAVIFADDDYRELLERTAQEMVSTPVKLLTFGSHGSGVTYRDLVLNSEGMASATMLIGGEAQQVQLGIMGAHNMNNAACAASIGEILGVDSHGIKRGLEQTKSQPGRGRVIWSHRGFRIIDDAYNANAESMKASLAMFESIQSTGRHIVILGELASIGDEERAHKLFDAIGAQIAESPVIDMLITIGAPATPLMRSAIDAGMSPLDCFAFENVALAAEQLEEVITPDDVVLVKASNIAGLDRMVRVMSSWS